jgi:hypothetical protein
MYYGMPEISCAYMSLPPSEERFQKVTLALLEVMFNPVLQRVDVATRHHLKDFLGKGWRHGSSGRTLMA